MQQAAKEDAEHVEFLEKEIEYNTQLKEALNGIQDVRKMLDGAEGAGVEGRLLDALNILARMLTWNFVCIVTNMLQNHGRRWKISLHMKSLGHYRY